MLRLHVKLLCKSLSTGEEGINNSLSHQQRKGLLISSFPVIPSHSAHLSVSVESFFCRIPAGFALCSLTGWWGCFQWKRTQLEPLGPLLPSHMTGRFWCRWQVCQRPEESSTPFQMQAEPYCCAADVFDRGRLLASCWWCEALGANMRKLDAGMLFVSLCRECVWAC